MKKEIITYLAGDENLCDEVEQIWHQLVRNHYNNSKYFKEIYKSLSFENRRAEFLELSKKGDLHIILAKDNYNKTIGYCVSSVVNSIGEIASICIDENYRGNGIGNSLMEKSLDWIKSKKVSSIFVSVSFGNEIVFPFYEKHGFYPRLTKLQMK